MALLLDLLVTGNTRLNDDTYAKNIYADKFIKNGSSDSYVLLGGGGHKTLNDFSMKNHTHSEYLPCLRMRNPSTSNDAPGQGGIPFPISLKGAGYPLYDDPEFAVGTNNVIVYNNSSGGAVTLTRIPDNQKSNNSSRYILQISTSAATASPGRGGFYQKIPAEPNAVYAQIFRAKIPVGFSVVNVENPMGTGYSTHWLTDTAGTGKWEWYIRVTICGKEGTFNESGGGHVHLSGTGAVTWYISYCNVIDLTMGNYDGLRTKYSDNASHVTVNPRNNNANYSMVFQYGTSLCSSTGIYCNPNTGYMYSNGVDTNTLKCNSKFTLVPTNTDDTGQAIAGATAPVVLVTSATAVTVPAGNANGAMVILVKVGTRDKTYRADNGIKFYCCWEGGARNTTSFTQIEQSCMMIYYNKVWYVMQFT